MRAESFRVGADRLLVDAEGNSRISAEDLAVALLDVLQSGAPIRSRATAAY